MKKGAQSLPTIRANVVIKIKPSSYNNKISCLYIHLINSYVYLAYFELRHIRGRNTYYHEHNTYMHTIL